MTQLGKTTVAVLPFQVQQSDVQLMKQLGAGAFGQVVLVSSVVELFARQPQLRRAL
eukprot:m.295877 g.295877  ORF g.295877 m.295877 type:complete len:56 (+) comp62937_c0_seq1:84-251(+)